MTLRPRSLAAKLSLMGAAVLVVAFGSIGLTLWISWHLEGGAAAVNEAGRLRMLSYRLALAVPDAPRETLLVQARGVDEGLDVLRRGDPARPLFSPGQKVRITEGPFAGLDAVFDLADGEARAMVLIELLSKQVRLPLEVTQIRAWRTDDVEGATA